MTFEPFQNSYALPQGRSSSLQPIIGLGGMLYYRPRNPVVCYKCGEEGHIHPNCPKSQIYIQLSSIPEVVCMNS